jgi:hypothetical protein
MSPNALGKLDVGEGIDAGYSHRMRRRSADAGRVNLPEMHLGYIL